MEAFVVPAIGISTPLTSRLRFGVGAYGVSGMGAGYKFADNMAVNISYMHGFEETITETSADDLVTLESTLKEDSVSIGFTVQF